MGLRVDVVASDRVSNLWQQERAISGSRATAQGTREQTELMLELVPPEAELERRSECEGVVGHSRSRSRSRRGAGCGVRAVACRQLTASDVTSQ